ncbi:shikimate dehydrogenase family protein [Sphingobacterium sp. Mn56C]|uniref:shikimate dehydrogenase family protein n=1 Tax=Sphingobacterium sp. Mn56C TaxID=3395261 RepID=UPI003BC7E366
MIKLGLIGYPLGHSFSKKYYLEKFENEHITGVDYDLYPVEHVPDFVQQLIADTDFRGFNITIPHKQSIIPFLTELSEEAQDMQAVNCVTRQQKDGRVVLKGYNTDAFGFEESLKPLLKPGHKKALVLGNGGAAKAVFYVLRKLGIAYLRVSRTAENGDITYADLDENLMQTYTLIVNCSPVGTFPHVTQAPDIPYQYITEAHLLYDLIYNPAETAFLKYGKDRGAQVKNGYDMLVLQAEKNWQIWSNNF